MVDSFVNFLHSIPSDVVILLEFATLFAFLMGLVSGFRKTGLFIFIVITMIVANLQVLKVVEYSFYPDPIALGKIVICFTFLASDILAEYYGKESAFKGVYIGFSANIGFMFMMLLTVGYPPLEITDGVNFHNHLSFIFTPIPGIFFAAVIAYFVSQFLDITAFLKLKDYFNGKYVWVRSFLSTVLASLVDNIIFYTLAFVVFNDFAMEYKTLIYTYILGTFVFRVGIASLSSTIIYAVKAVVDGKLKLGFGEIEDQTVNQS